MCLGFIQGPSIQLTELDSSETCDGLDTTGKFRATRVRSAAKDWTKHEKQIDSKQKQVMTMVPNQAQLNQKSTLQ